VRSGALGAVLLALTLAGVAALPTRAAAQAAAPAADAEGDAYRAWYEVRDDAGTATELARAYLARYPEGRYADYLRRWLASTRARLFNEASAARDLDAMVRLANEAPADDPQSLDYAYLVAYRGREALLGGGLDPGRAAAVVELAERAIALVAGGRVPGVIDVTAWSRDRTLAWLHQTVAIVDDRSGRRDAALARYARAAALDPADPYNALACGSIHQKTYTAAVERLNAFPAAEREDPERRPLVKLTLEEVNREADAIIRCWVRFVALTAEHSAYAEARQQVMRVLAELYAYRHPGTPGGLETLIREQAVDGKP
jgi:hypothetical protein